MLGMDPKARYFDLVQNDPQEKNPWWLLTNDQGTARWWVVGSAVFVLADALSLLIGATPPGAMLAFAVISLTCGIAILGMAVASWLRASGLKRSSGRTEGGSNAHALTRGDQD